MDYDNTIFERTKSKAVLLGLTEPNEMVYQFPHVGLAPSLAEFAFRGVTSLSIWANFLPHFEHRKSKADLQVWATEKKCHFGPIPWYLKGPEIEHSNAIDNTHFTLPYHHQVLQIQVVMTAIPVGVYVFKNEASGTVVDLQYGNSENGTRAQGCGLVAFDNQWAYDQYWFVQPVHGGNTYTICNLKSGTVLELNDGAVANGTQAQGSARILDPSSAARLNQEWTFELLAAPDSYRLVNKRSGTALDLENGNTAEGTNLQGCQIQVGNTNQQWFVQRRTTPTGN